MCSEDNITIVNMTLSQFGLVGEFSDDTFFGLNTTVKVDMYKNSITGELPREGFTPPTPVRRHRDVTITLACES